MAGAAARRGARRRPRVPDRRRRVRARCSSATARRSAEQIGWELRSQRPRPARLDAVRRPRARRARARPTRRSSPAPTRRSTRSSATAATASRSRPGSPRALNARRALDASRAPGRRARSSPSTLSSAPGGSATSTTRAAGVRDAALARDRLRAQAPGAAGERRAREPAGRIDDVEHAVARVGRADARAAAERAACTATITCQAPPSKTARAVDAHGARAAACSVAAARSGADAVGERAEARLERLRAACGDARRARRWRR